jgi:selenocysteine lyase/cysteine desulfurase
MLSKLLNKKQTQNVSNAQDFGYLKAQDYYFDSSCQTLRPESVIEAQKDYFHNFNACGHRVKYKWGQEVDKKVEECRHNLLKLVKKSPNEYTVYFGLNATSAINLALHQLPDIFDSVVTSEVEHSSVFLPSITWAKNRNKQRKVLSRNSDGSLNYQDKDLEKSVVIVNSTTNYDGVHLTNAKQLAEDVHRQGGILILDACQTFGHNHQILHEVDFDVVVSSGHKMYGPSLGFGIIKKPLVKQMDTYYIGGSTITDNDKDNFELIEEDEELFARLEPGLQNFAGIVGLNQAILWKNNFQRNSQNALEYEKSLADYLFASLQKIDGLKILNDKPSSVVSVYSDNIESYKLGGFLGEKGIMCRTGYHCCYYYLKHLKEYPQLLRISLGLNNNQKDIDYLKENLSFILKNFA